MANCIYFKVTNEMSRPERCFPGKKNLYKPYECGPGCDILAGVNRQTEEARYSYVRLPGEDVHNALKFIAKGE